MAKRIVDEEMRFRVIINGDEAQKELFDLEKSTKDLTRANKDLKAEKERLKALGKQETEEYKKISVAIKENNQALRSNKARMKELQGEIGITSLTMAQLSQRARQLKLELRHAVPGTANHQRLQAELRETTARMKELGAQARATQTSAAGITQGFSRFAAIGASVVASAAGMYYSFQKLADINGELADAQADVQKTTQMTKEQVEELTLELGKFSTRTSRIELLKLAEEAGRLGVTGVDNLREFVKVAEQMKVALGDELSDEAIREVGKMTNIFKVGEQTGRDFAGSMLSLGSAINEVSASGANQASFLVEFLKRVAGVADITGITADEMVGLAAAMDEVGVSQEIAGTAISKTILAMFSNVEKFADAAGIAKEELQELLNTDTNEALLRFVEGLNSTGVSTEELVGKLDGLDIGGERGVRALLSLATATDTARERQETASKALQEATSLTDEAAVKNNNLAASLQKVSNWFSNAFTRPEILNSLNWIVTKFGQLVGAIEDTEEAFNNETKATYESARSKNADAAAASALLEEYEDLTADGVEPTEEAKRRLDEITLLLRDHLGDSVVAIDKETGALKLNTDAVKEQIRLKRIAADEEASTLASRLQGTIDARKKLQQEIEQLEREAATRAGMVTEEDRKKMSRSVKSYDSRVDATRNLEVPESIEKLNEVNRKLTETKKKLADQEERRLEIVSALEELNYDESIVDDLYTPKTPEFEEGDTREVEGQMFEYKNGKWVPVKVEPGGDGGGDGGGTGNGGQDPVVDLKRKQAELRRIQEENNRLRASLIDDAFKQELALEDANHQAKIAKLKEQMIDEAELKGMSPEARQIAIQQNKELNAQIELEEEIHQNKIGAILQKGIEAQIQAEQEAFDRETIRRQTAHNRALAALGNNEEAKRRLQDQFNQQEEVRQKQHLERLISQMKEILQSADFQGVELDLLPPEERQKLLDFLDEVNLKLSELLGKKGSAGGKEEQAIDGDVDVLGFSKEQWDITFEKLDTTAQKLEAAQLAVGGLMNAWGMYSDFQRRRQEVEMRDFERAQDKKAQDLKRNLDAGYINQRQYDAAIQAMDQERRKKQAEMEYKQAKREKEMAVANIGLNGAVAISKALAQGGFVLGVPWAAIIGGLTAIQLAMALATPLPAKGYEDGLYPVKREQDGKMFKASYGGETRSGLVNKPTMFLAGEGGKRRPEMIIDDRAWAKMDPAVKDSIYRELGRMGRVPGYEGGYYPEMRPVESRSTSETTADYTLFTAALNRNSEIMERIEQQGIKAILLRNMETAKKIQDDINDYNKLRNANKR